MNTSLGQTRGKSIRLQGRVDSNTATKAIPLRQCHRGLNGPHSHLAPPAGGGGQPTFMGPWGSSGQGHAHLQAWGSRWCRGWAVLLPPPALPAGLPGPGSSAGAPTGSQDAWACSSALTAQCSSCWLSEAPMPLLSPRLPAGHWEPAEPTRPWLETSNGPLFPEILDSHTVQQE